MAPPTRHFKICFNSDEVFWKIMWRDHEDHEITGLFNFVVRGMKLSYDYVFDDIGEFFHNYVVDTSAVEQLPNGTWTGVVGLLNRSEMDYAPAALTMTEERWDAMSYNYPYASDELVFVTRQPEYSPETMAMFRTLSPSVWSSLLACIILVTLACFVAMKHRCTLGDILLHVLAIGLNQEGNLVPRRAGEVLLLSTWLGAMAVFTFCFKSVLLSFLTFPPLDGVRTVPELAKAIRAGQYSAFADYDNDFPSYLQRSPNDDFQVIGESMLKNPRSDLDYLIHESPKYPIMALVYTRSQIAFAEGVLYVSKDNMGSLYSASAVRKSFCCKDEMDMLVHRFLAAGINQKIKRLADHKYTFYFIHDTLPSSKLPEGEETTRKITVTDLSGAFILLVAGHCLSLCVLIVECWMKRREGCLSSTRNKQCGVV